MAQQTSINCIWSGYAISVAVKPKWNDKTALKQCWKKKWGNRCPGPDLNRRSLVWQSGTVTTRPSSLAGAARILNLYRIEAGLCRSIPITKSHIELEFVGNARSRWLWKRVGLLVYVLFKLVTWIFGGKWWYCKSWEWMAEACFYVCTRVAFLPFYTPLVTYACAWTTRVSVFFDSFNRGRLFHTC